MGPQAKALETSLQGFPGVRKVVATSKAFRELMLERDGQMLLNGQLWDIDSKPLGAGLRSVWIKPANPPGAPR